MPVVNPTDLAFLRNLQPPQTEWFVAVAPWGNPVFEARVNNPAIERGEMEIDFDGGVGTLGSVEPGMTLWVGSAGSANDLGSVRIRWIVGSTFGVSENDDILWTDDLFLTVPGEAGFREPWSVFPRMVEAGGAVTFYKDYDRAYNNEGDHLPPKANAGPPAIAFIDPTSGLATLNWIGEDSYATETAGVPLVAWAWQFPDGTPPTSALEGTLAAPIEVTWNSPGFRYVKLVVEDSLGTTGTTHIPVWIFDESGPEVPWRQVEVTDQMGSVASGWSARLKVFGAGPSDFPDRSLVVLGIRTRYRGTRREIGGYSGRENIRFVGWVNRETLTYDADVGTVEFEAQGLTGVMGQMPAFTLYLEENGSPSEWYEMVDNNVDRMSHHVLEYHSTINQIAHVNRPGEGNTRKIEAAGFPDTNLLAQLQDHLWMDTMGMMTADRQGILQITRDPQMMEVADRNAVATVCTLTDRDWISTVDVPTSHVPELGFVELGGFGYGTPYLSRAPGAAPLQQEQATRVDGCILDTADPQVNANWWSGLTLTKKNTPYPALPISLKGFWPVFDPAFQEWVRLDFEDPNARHPFENARFLVREVSFQDDPKTSTTITQLVLESENELLCGETVNIPPPPPPDPPYYPPAPTPEPTPPPPSGSIRACVAWHRNEVGYTPDLLERHFVSVTTAGTAGITLFDTAADFDALGIVVGDVVENLTDSTSTHVAAVVSATQLTLDANIGLGVGTEYSTCGTQWTDITPANFNPATEYIIQFVYTRTSTNVLGGWLLTTHDVYYTPNILTASPSWSIMLTIETVRTATGFVGPNNQCLFHGMHAMVASPQYLIVSFDHQNHTSDYGCVYTGNLGGAWAYSTLSDYDGRITTKFGIEIDENTGMIFNFRGRGGAECYVCVSGDGGANFTKGMNLKVANWCHGDRRADLYRPYLGSALDVTIHQSLTSPGVSADDGTNWSAFAAAGYEDPGNAGDGGGGIIGWAGNASDLLAIWMVDDPGGPTDENIVLLRSSDAGATWTEIGDAYVQFPWMPFGAILNAVVAQTWNPDEDELVWTGTCERAAGIESCRIKYTMDNGAHWSGKMGNWYTTGLDWDGGGVRGGVDCMPLPRVGANE